MDIWLFYHVIHRLHDFLNPFSDEGFRELRQALDPAPGARVLDVGCGKGEMLVRLAEECGISGVGVDKSPYFAREAERRRRERVPAADLRILEGSGEDYHGQHAGEGFEVAMCVGASWIWNGYAGTLEALEKLARPGGLVVLGEPYWLEKPDPRFLEAEELESEEVFCSLQELNEAAGGEGLALVWMRGSSLQEWDRYEMLQTASLDRFEREEPDHPDLAGIRRRLARNKDAYLRWGRECLGFAVWVFRKR